MENIKQGFCLGTGAMDKCKTCLHEHNWLMLNQMPNPLRLKLQKTMVRIPESLCQLKSGSFYSENIK